MIKYEQKQYVMNIYLHTIVFLMIKPNINHIFLTFTKGLPDLQMQKLPSELS